MDNKLYSQVIKHIINSKIFILIILYIFIGTFFISSEYAGNSYFNMFLQILNNKNFICVFLLPANLLIFFDIYKTIFCLKTILLRIHKKKEILNLIIKSILLTTLYFYVVVLIVIAISINVTGFKAETWVNTIGIGNAPDILFAFVSVIKIYCSTIILLLLFLIIINILKETKKTLLFMLVYIMIIFLNTRFMLQGVFYYLNPNIHIYYYSDFKSIWDCIVISLIYYLIFIPILYYLVRRIFINSNSVGDLKNE